MKKVTKQILNDLRSKGLTTVESSVDYACALSFLLRESEILDLTIQYDDCEQFTCAFSMVSKDDDVEKVFFDVVDVDSNDIDYKPSSLSSLIEGIVKCYYKHNGYDE